MAETRIEGLEAVNQLLADLPEESFEVAQRAMRRAAFRGQRRIQGRFESNPETSLRNRTGNLQRSIRSSVRGNSLASLSAEVFTDSIYAPIHETGGVIKARNAFRSLDGGPFLAIPSEQNQTEAGVTRYSVRDAFTLGGFLRRIRIPNRAQYFIADGELGDPLFWLVPSVEIPARLRMTQTVVDQIPSLINELNAELLGGG